MKNVLTEKEREALGADLTALAKKYLGFKRGLVQSLSVKASMNEAITIKMEVLL